MFFKTFFFLDFPKDPAINYVLYFQLIAQILQKRSCRLDKDLFQAGKV